MATQTQTHTYTESGPEAEHVHKGRCFCGTVEVEARGDPTAQGYCHCESCRSISGAPVRGFTLWPKDAVRVTRGEDKLKGFNKMGFSDRQHCTECGGQVLIQHPTIGLADVHSAILPDFDFGPALHVHYQEKVLPIRDGLPKFRDFPAGFGGSDELLPE
jgi:hypothetical protein